MDAVKEMLMNAEIAFSNRQYETALSWYQKVLEQTPEDIYVLSRAGAICVPLGKFEEAADYFSRARDLDPGNGDNTFNYANACFFGKDYAKAFAMYVEAEKLGCSEDVAPRLYYQMALLCSMRQDIKSALVYFRKCEESDKTGMISLNPDLISEKLKLYMMLQDFPQAEKCAAQLVAVNPTQFKSYMVYFSIAMAHKNYELAQKLLADAADYAELTGEDRFGLTLQQASLLVTQGEQLPEQRQAYCDRAIALLEECGKDDSLTPEQALQLKLTLAETCYKAEKYDRAIPILQNMLSSEPDPVAEPVAQEIPGELAPDEIEDQLYKDMDRIQDLVDTGELDEDLGYLCETEFDEDGNEVHVYDPEDFAMLNEEKPLREEAAPKAAQKQELPKEFREKAIFQLLSCYMAKDSFENVRSLAGILRHSDNKYYSYYGLYTDALSERKLSGDSLQTQRKYTEAIAFFRNKSFTDKQDTLASVFRARLYAEQGKYEKAREIAHLLSDADRQSVLAYVDQCGQA